jgi:hypothetical protein
MLYAIEPPYSPRSSFNRFCPGSVTWIGASPSKARP